MKNKGREFEPEKQSNIKADNFEVQIKNQITKTKLEIINTANSIKINSENFINEWFKKRREGFLKEAWQELSDKIDKGITYFTDRAGRKWDIVTYIDMKTQTEFMNAYREAFLLRAVQYKVDLVRIKHLNYHPTCPLCKPFENKILSIKGKTKGYMTIDEATAYGLFHPRCDHIEEFELITEKMPRKMKKKYKKERLKKDGIINLNEANKKRYKYNLKRSEYNNARLENNSKKQTKENKTSLNAFIDGVVNNNLQENINDIVVGHIAKNVQNFLEKEELILKDNPINLTYRRILHSLRDNKNPLQKVTLDQIKRIDEILKQNNVYFDTLKNNLIYVAQLPSDEITNGRNWIKIPINIYKNKNEIATLSRISSNTITNDKRYIKID